MGPCPFCSQEVDLNLEHCSHCGRLFSSSEGDSTGGVIPYKNPKALVAYYLGLFSILPFLGLFLGIAAFVLGILGLRDRKRNPAIKGSLHAGIGIGCGGLMTLVWIAAIVALVASA